MSMRACLLVLALLCCAQVHAGESDTNVAFVGRLVSITPAKEEPCNDKVDPKTGDTIVCIQFDAVFDARYEVLEVIVGKLDTKFIDFKVYDHYGMPPFAETANATALLFLGHDRDGWFLHKYQGFSVMRTVDNDWASCGDPLKGRDTPERVEPIEFATLYASTRGDNREFEKTHEWLMPHLSITGTRVRCHAGVRVVDLYERTRTGVMAAREEAYPPLPAQR